MKKFSSYAPALAGALCYGLCGQVSAHVANIDITKTGVGESGEFTRNGWIAGTNATLGDSHHLTASANFFTFHLAQTSLVTITFSQISGQGGSVLTTGGLDPAFSLYSGFLPDASHDDTPYDPLEGNTVDLAPAGHVYVPHDGYRDTVNFSATGGLPYQGQFDALGDWSMANEDAVVGVPETLPGNWAKIKYLTHVNDHVTALGTDQMPPGAIDNTPETLNSYYLLAGDYTIAASGASCNNPAKVACVGPLLWGRVTFSAVPTATNTAPVFVGGTTALTVPNAGGLVDLKPNLHVSDTDSGQAETWTATTAPAHGTLTVTGATAASGGTDIAPGGTLTYKPAAGYVGTDTFAVSVGDGIASAVRTFTVKVTANTAPSFVGGATASLTLAQNRSPVDLKQNLRVSDKDPNQTETWTRKTAPLHGTLTLTNAKAASGSGNILPGGTLTYQPAVGYAGTDSFAVNVGDGAATATRSFAVTITPNIAPVFVGGSTSLTLAQSRSALDLKPNLHVGDADVGQTEKWSVAAAPAHGVLTVASATAASGSANITPAGTLTYKPAVGYVGSDTFTVAVSDGAATINRVFTATMTKNVPPVFVGGTTGLSLLKNSAAVDLKPNLHIGDPDIGQTERWMVSAAPAHGTLAVTSATAASGGADIAPGGTLTYQPAAGYVGTDTFTIKVGDGVIGIFRKFTVTVN